MDDVQRSEYLESLKQRDYLRGHEVEALYGISRETLKKWRAQKTGPEYIQRGNGKGSPVFYTHEAMKEFMEMNVKNSDSGGNIPCKQF